MVLAQSPASPSIARGFPPRIEQNEEEPGVVTRRQKGAKPPVVSRLTMFRRVSLALSGRTLGTDPPRRSGPMFAPQLRELLAWLEEGVGPD